MEREIYIKGKRYIYIYIYKEIERYRETVKDI